MIGCRIPIYVFTEANTPFIWSRKIGQSSCSFCRDGTLSEKSKNTGKKHTAHDDASAVTGVRILALHNKVVIVIAAIPRIFRVMETINICKKVKP